MWGCLYYADGHGGRGNRAGELVLGSDGEFAINHLSSLAG